MQNWISVINIREYLKKDESGNREDRLRQLLAGFSCGKIRMWKKLKPITVNAECVSKTMRRKIDRVGKADISGNTYTLWAFLIAQLGKNYTEQADKNVTGEQLLEAAAGIIREIQYMVGGTVVFLEAEDNEKLMQFYEEKMALRDLTQKYRV